MPQTALVFVVGALALAGIPPLSGFFSKEAILAGVWEAELPGPLRDARAHRVPHRLLHVPRRSSWRSSARGTPRRTPHDPPAVMALPLWVLAVLSVGAGVLATRWLGLSLAEFAPRESRSRCPTARAGSCRSRWGWRSPASSGRGWSTSARPCRRWRSAGRSGGWRGRPSRATGWTRRTPRSTGAPCSGWRGSSAGSTATWWTGSSTSPAHGRSRPARRLRLIQTGRPQDYLYGVAAGVVLLALLWTAW